MTKLASASILSTNEIVFDIWARLCVRCFYAATILVVFIIAVLSWKMTRDVEDVIDNTVNGVDKHIMNTALTRQEKQKNNIVVKKKTLQKR